MTVNAVPTQIYRPFVAPPRTAKDELQTLRDAFAKALKDKELLAEAEKGKMTIDYVSPDESLERFASASENVVVCKSMSKVYALSGARAAYLCGPRAWIQDLRSITPPWVVGLPSQIAGVLALRDPRYYQARYAETRRLRDELGAALRQVGVRVWPGRANFLLCQLPDGAGGAAELLARCRQHGLFLRDVSSMTTRPDARMFRVAVKDRATNERMVGDLHEAMRSPLR